MAKIDANRTILLVEDNEADAFSVQRAFKKAGLMNPIMHVTSGEQALDFLNRTGEFAEHPEDDQPVMVLLDLNMPGMDGIELLRVIRHDSKRNLLPVIILTTSTDDRDIENCYREGANSYIQKPVDFDGLIEAIKRLKEFWFELVIVPRIGKD